MSVGCAAFFAVAPFGSSDSLSAGDLLHPWRMATATGRYPGQSNPTVRVSQTPTKARQAKSPHRKTAFEPHKDYTYSSAKNIFKRYMPVLAQHFVANQLSSNKKKRYCNSLEAMPRFPPLELFESSPKRFVSKAKASFRGAASPATPGAPDAEQQMPPPGAAPPPAEASGTGELGSEQMLLLGCEGLTSF